MLSERTQHPEGSVMRRRHVSFIAGRWIAISILVGIIHGWHASAQTAIPESVLVTDVTERGSVVSWTSTDVEVGSVMYRKSGTADAFTLFERFEGKLQKHQGNLLRAAVELAKDWRTDRMLRRLEAMLAVADRSTSLIISGTGDVIEPEQGIMAIGSGSAYAKAAARALLEETELDARMIVEKSLLIAADICIYTNDQLTLEELDG